MKKVIIFICAILITIVLYLLKFYPKHLASSDENKYKEYLWLFKRNERSKINFGVSIFGENDVLNELWYNLDYTNNLDLKIEYVINIWEFKDNKNINIKDVNFYKDDKLEDVFYGNFELIDDKISIKNDFNFDNGVNVSLSKDADINLLFEESNYTGFYGTTKGYSLTNAKNESQIFVEKNQWNDLILLFIYKKNDCFYLISVQSKNKYFDKSIINIFDLK